MGWARGAGSPPLTSPPCTQTYFEDNPRDLHVLRHDKPLHPAIVKPHLRNVPDYLGTSRARQQLLGQGGDTRPQNGAWGKGVQGQGAFLGSASPSDVPLCARSASQPPRHRQAQPEEAQAAAAAPRRCSPPRRPHGECGTAVTPPGTGGTHLSPAFLGSDAAFLCPYRHAATPTHCRASSTPASAPSTVPRSPPEPLLPPRGCAGDHRSRLAAPLADGVSPCCPLWAAACNKGAGGLCQPCGGVLLLPGSAVPAGCVAVAGAQGRVGDAGVGSLRCGTKVPARYHPPLINSTAVNWAKGTAHTAVPSSGPPRPLEVPVTPTPTQPRCPPPAGIRPQGWRAHVPWSLAPVCHQHSAFGAPEFALCPPALCAQPCPWRARRVAAPRCPYRPPLPLIGASACYQG